MSDLPSGTVTFLFTDIEGSTRIWEQYPDQMRIALARHNVLLREAIERHHGHVFKTVGDAFCAAFSTASDALSAALAAQQALTSEPWLEPVTIKVRMALHTGAAEARDNDYFGQPLNRVARLLSAGHGGQVLLSLPTEELARDLLPVAVSLEALGEHRLRDLNRPEAVFQLHHPDLPAEFPPLKSLDQLPNNLPRQLTSFIGREKEIDAIESLLTRTSLLTLTGSGGCGKTRLALQVAADVLEQYPDGVWLVELAPLSDPALVPQTVASALGMTEQTGKTFVQMLTDYLKSKRLLLVLDNCEHLLNACVQLCDALLRSCPNLTILTSSREGLGIGGELTYRVPSLSLPDTRQPLTVEQIGQYEAVRLFIERAQLHLPAFVVTNASAPALAAVCHRLDGIPLAIELAAARVRSLSVEEINTRLDNRFRLLTGGSRTALPRQQTLRALIDWSYGLLTDQEKLLLCRLAVFAGGWTLPAAEQVCAGESADGGEGLEDWEVLDLLTSLMDKSLVIAEMQAGATRYRLLETVRQYAQELLVDSEESEAVRARHRDFFLALAEEAEPQLSGAENGRWLERLETEHDNLRQALAFCLEEAGGVEASLRLGAALWRFWERRGHLGEGRAHMGVVLRRAVDPEQNLARAHVMQGAGQLAFKQGDLSVAQALHEESLAIYRELGDRRGVANSDNLLGLVVAFQGDFAAARALHEESLAIFRSLGDRRGMANSLHGLGAVAQDQGDNAMARAHYEKSLAIRREMGDRQGVGGCLNNLGNVAKSEGDFAAARALLEESLAIFRELGNRWAIAVSLYNLGNIAVAQDDYARARALYEESLAIDRELGNRLGIASSLAQLGSVASELGHYAAARALLEESLAISRELGDKQSSTSTLDTFAHLAYQEQQRLRAAHLWGVTSSLRAAMGLPRSAPAQERYEREVAQARVTLGEAIFDSAFEESLAMTWEQAVEYALKKEGSL